MHMNIHHTHVQANMHKHTYIDRRARHQCALYISLSLSLSLSLTHTHSLSRFSSFSLSLALSLSIFFSLSFSLPPSLSPSRSLSLSLPPPLALSLCPSLSISAGGLGKLMEVDVFEVYLCTVGHPCSGSPDAWFCWSLHPPPSLTHRETLSPSRSLGHPSSL